ncbi:MAG: gliding motility-associated C-terminal domain-containing protein [Bacteroidia bacterium]|nr:gliding motility-associated C-terminal domain-containing protein [Bacteroidia bacterium]
MKRFAEISLMILCVLGIFKATCVNAQSNIAERKYRVIAYKQGANEITSMSNEVTVTPNMAIYVPNSFTPNGDGMNETFGAYSEGVKDFTMQVYNRWGQLIFESSDINQHWDGKFRGELAPQGSYVYKIQAKAMNGRIITKKGTVNLVM